VNEVIILTGKVKKHELQENRIFFLSTKDCFGI